MIQSFRTDLIKFIDHCAIVTRHSKSQAYRSFARLQALDFCIEVKRYAKTSCTDASLARFALQRRKHLHAILPMEMNASFLSSMEKLSSLLEFAQSLTNNNNNNYGKAMQNSLQAGRR